MKKITRTRRFSNAREGRPETWLVLGATTLGPGHVNTLSCRLVRSGDGVSCDLRPVDRKVVWVRIPSIIPNLAN